MYYSIVSSTNRIVKKSYKNIYYGKSEFNTFASVMYKHNEHCCKIIESIGLFNVLKQEPIMFCLTNTYSTLQEKIFKLSKPQCFPKTIYSYKTDLNKNQIDSNIHANIDWKVIYGSILTVKKFTEIYKTYQEDKINLNQIISWSLGRYKYEELDILTDNPPKAVVSIHDRCKTGMYFKINNEKI